MNDEPRHPGGPTDPYGAQDPYGQQQNQYGQHPQHQPWSGAPTPPAPPVPSSATTSMVLGIIALASLAVACGIGLVLAPFAWVIGGRAVREIDASHGALGGRDQAQAGRVMGILGTVMLGLVVVIAVAVIALVLVGGVATYEFGETSTNF